MGCVWIPVFGLATRDLKPELTGVGSGVLSTLQEFGAVLGTALIGALLQNRLAAGLHDQARQYADQAPGPYRDQFVAGFTHTGGGMEIGAGQAGGSQLPAHLPEPVRRQLAALAQQVFGHGFVGAMRPAMVLPIALIALIAVACTLVRSGPSGTGVQEAAEVETAPVG